MRVCAARTPQSHSLRLFMHPRGVLLVVVALAASPKILATLARDDDGAYGYGYGYGDGDGPPPTVTPTAAAPLPTATPLPSARPSATPMPTTHGTVVASFDELSAAIDGTERAFVEGRIMFASVLTIESGRTLSLVGRSDAQLDGAGDSQLFYVVGSLTLRSLTLMRGNANAMRPPITASNTRGGCVNVFDSGSLKLISCVFRGNSAFLGGAIASLGTLIAAHTTFVNNSADSGGGQCRARAKPHATRTHDLAHARPHRTHRGHRRPRPHSIVERLLAALERCVASRRRSRSGFENLRVAERLLAALQQRR